MKRFPIALICILPILSLLAGCGGFNNVPPGDVSPQAQGAVRAAYSQMGKPYRIGGASPRQGFDCSGLIYWAYGKNGVKVPRITKEGSAARRSWCEQGRSPARRHRGLPHRAQNPAHRPVRWRQCLYPCSAQGLEGAHGIAFLSLLERQAYFHTPYLGLIGNFEKRQGSGNISGPFLLWTMPREFGGDKGSCIHGYNSLFLRQIDGSSKFEFFKSRMFHVKLCAKNVRARRLHASKALWYRLQDDA